MSVSRTNDSCYGVAGLAAEVTHELVLVLVGRLDEQVAVVAGNLAAPLVGRSLDAVDGSGSSAAVA